MSLRRTVPALKGVADTTYASGTLVFKLPRAEFNNFVAEEDLLLTAKKRGALGNAALIEFQDGHRMIVKESELVRAETVTLSAESREVWPEDHPHKNLETVPVSGGVINHEMGTLIEVGSEELHYSYVLWTILS